MASTAPAHPLHPGLEPDLLAGSNGPFDVERAMSLLGGTLHAVPTPAGSAPKWEYHAHGRITPCDNTEAVGRAVWGHWVVNHVFGLVCECFIGMLNDPSDPNHSLACKWMNEAEDWKDIDALHLVWPEGTPPPFPALTDWTDVNPDYVAFDFNRFGWVRRAVERSRARRSATHLISAMDQARPVTPFRSRL